MEVWVVILIVIAAVLLTALVTAVVVRSNDRKKVAYMLDSFEDGELNFRFVENSSLNRTLNRIRWIFEKQRQRSEQESWTKLIRVLTHEIMNTVSPIASLSEALGKYADFPAEDRGIDLKAGLETISDSSKNLISFVERYRELAGVARPVKKAVMVDELVYKVINLTSCQCSKAGALCKYEAKDKDLLIYADEGQVSQILVNLIKNALEAGASQVALVSKTDKDDQIIIEVSNNGDPITKESQEQIFIPFYTTKPAGSGIGLSLSRQIMNCHNGSLNLLESNDQRTVFTLVFK